MGKGFGSKYNVGDDALPITIAKNWNYLKVRRPIQNTWKYILQGLRWSIGDKRKENFWIDYWLV